MYNKINWILGTNNVKLLAIWFKCQYLHDRQKNTGKKIQMTLTLEFHYSHTLQVSNPMMLLRIAISWATTIYPNAH